MTKLNQVVEMSSCSISQKQPAWVTLMEAHYREKGFYRAEDLSRLTGDPKDAFGKSIDPNGSFAGRLLSK